MEPLRYYSYRLSFSLDYYSEIKWASDFTTIGIVGRDRWDCLKSEFDNYDRKKQPVIVEGKLTYEMILYALEESLSTDDNDLLAMNIVCKGKSYFGNIDIINFLEEALVDLKEEERKKRTANHKQTISKLISIDTNQ